MDGRVREMQMTSTLGMILLEAKHIICGVFKYGIKCIYPPTVGSVGTAFGFPCNFESAGFQSYGMRIVTFGAGSIAIEL
jgi:hypothetical protein